MYISPSGLGYVETSQALLVLRQLCDLDFQLRKERRWQGCSGWHHESILGLKQMARPLPTRDSGKLRSSWHTWSMCYFLSPPLNLSFHWSLVLWLLAILRFWYVSHELRSISHCWGLAAQIGLIEFIWKFLPNEHSVSRSCSPSPAEVKLVKVDAPLTCDSLPWCYVMLFSRVVIPVATTIIIWHIILPDACLSCAVLALAGFTPAE